MSLAARIPKLGKIAVLSAIGGSFYYLKDDIKSAFKNDPQPPSQQAVEKPAPPAPIESRTIDQLPEHIPYLLVGAGTASHAAMRAIRVEDPKSKVLILGKESYGPYMRPALSKELWTSDKNLRENLAFSWVNGREKSIFYEPDEFYLPLELMTNRETGGVSLITDTSLLRLDPENKTAHLDTGQTLKYDKCLLAPGARPKSLPQLKDAPQELQNRIVYFRSVDDFMRLDELARVSKSVLVVGGGELGTGIASSLVELNEAEKPSDQVIYNIFPESGHLAWMLPDYLSDHVTKKMQHEGTKVIPNVEIKQVSKSKDNRLQVELTNGETLLVDCIVCATDSEPNVDLAKSSGLEVDETTGGFLVNSELEARRNLWVAGDAASFYDTKFGRRRIESHDHAIFSGSKAGHNMAGQNTAYSHQPVLYCDIGTDIMLETVGIVDSNLKTVAIFAEQDDGAPAASSEGLSTEPEVSTNDGGSGSETREANSRRGLDPYDRGIVFYLKDDIIVGVLLWNVLGRLTIARRILHEETKYDNFNEVAKLFNLYLDD